MNGAFLTSPTSAFLVACASIKVMLKQSLIGLFFSMGTVLLSASRGDFFALGVGDFFVLVLYRTNRMINSSFQWKLTEPRYDFLCFEFKTSQCDNRNNKLNVHNFIIN